MKPPAALAIACAACLLVGCNTLTHRVARQQAHRRWSNVRAGVKFQLAQQQYRGGLFAEAVDTIRESLALDPSQADAYVVLARANLELSRLGSAKEALDAADLAGVWSPDLVYTRGVILEQQGRIAEALEKYTEARTFDPTNVEFLVAEAECLVVSGRAEEALAMLDKNANKLDDDGTLTVLAAHVAALMGDTIGAARRFADAVVPSADRGVVAEERGLLLAGSGHCAEAISVLKQLVQDRDESDTASWPRPSAGAITLDRPRRGSMRGRAGYAGEAGARGAVRRALAGCYLARDDPASALKTLQAYVERHAGDTPAQLLLAKAAVATDDMLTALRAIDAVERREPGRTEVKLVRAVIQWRRGRLAEAAESLEEVLAADPEDVEAHCLMAEVLLARRQIAAARTHFRRALTIDPHCSWAAVALKSLG